MPPGLNDDVKFLKGVGPQRAAMLAQRGIQVVEDLLYYLPFRYEDRTRFSKIREIQPGGTHTVLAEVVSGGLVRFARGRDAIYHLAVRDAGPIQPGLLHCRFFHGGYLEGKLKDTLSRHDEGKDLPAIPPRKARQVIDKVGALEPHVAVLETAMPALYGPHTGRHWVKILKSLTEIRARGC